MNNKFTLNANGIKKDAEMIVKFNLENKDYLIYCTDENESNKQVFVSKLTLNSEGKYFIDDITLEDYEYNFTSEIEENIEETSINLQKTLDITDILWQNILIEVPSKVVNEKNKNIKLEGNGWRLISEDDLNNKNNPLSELEELFRKE